MIFLRLISINKLQNIRKITVNRIITISYLQKHILKYKHFNILKPNIAQFICKFFNVLTRY